MPPRVAIFEPEADGHHFVYVRHIVREMLNRHWAVDLVTTARAQNHPSYEQFARDLGTDVQITLMPDTQTPDDASDFRRLRDQFARRRDYSTGYAALLPSGKPDACFMLNLDRADLPISVLGSPFGQTPFAGFLMGRQFHCPHVGVQVDSLRRRDKMAGPVFERMLRVPTLRKIISVDETLVTYAEMRRPRGWQKVVHVPDAAYIRTDVPPKSREGMGLPADKKIVLAFGSLSLRKGIAELLASCDSDDFPNEAVILLVGKQDEEVKALLQAETSRRLAETGRLLIREGFVDDVTESEFFQTADIVWVGYQNWFGMSGVLMQAGAMGKPVLAMHNGLIGYLTKSHELGLTVKIDSASEVANGFRTLVKDDHLAAKLGANGKEYAKGRTVEAFGRATCDVIQDTLS